jgi:hypothetical protein
MRPVVCPSCGKKSIFHYTDAYVLRKPVLKPNGKLDLVEFDTNEYDGSFFECLECGRRPSEGELVQAAA